MSRLMKRPVRAPRGTATRIGAAGSACAVGMVIALAACSSGGGSAGAARPVSTTVTSTCPNKSGNLTIGFLGAYTGNESFLGPDMYFGVKAALAEINAAGGVLGCKVGTTTGDTANDPVDAVPAYRKIASQGVPVIIGPTSEGESALPDMLRQQVPTFIQGGTTALDHITGNPYFFRTTPSDSVQAQAMAFFAIQKGWKRAALAFTNDTGSTPLVAPLKAAFAKLGGTIVDVASLVPDQANYQSAVASLQAAKPQVVFIQQDPQTAGTFFSEVSSAGFDAQTNWIGTNVEDTSDVFKAIGATAATTNFYATNGVSQGGSALTTFTQWYQKVNNTTVPANLSEMAYDATIIAALAIDRAGSLSGSAVAPQVTQVSSPPGQTVYNYADGLAALKAGKKINYDGVASTDDFNQYHNVEGPFGVYVFDKTGNTKQVASISAQDLQDA